MKPLGEVFLPTDTVEGHFNTSDPATAEPVTLAGTPSLDLVRTRAGVKTTITGAGITLDVDANGVVGYHEYAIDLDDANVAAQAGDEYAVRIAVGSAGGKSLVGRKVGYFYSEADGLTAGQSADVTAAVPTAAQIQAELEENGASVLDTIADTVAAKLASVSGQVASQSEVTAIQNNTRVVRVVPNVIERPLAGSRTYRIELFLYDETGNMEAPDSAPTIALVDQGGTDLSARLDSTTMTLVETGRYRAIYTSDAAHDVEQLVWTFSVVEGGNTRKYGNVSVIVDVLAVDFTAADRAKLDTLHDTRLTAARAANLDEITAARMAELDQANLPTDVSAASIRTAVGLATANLDTQFATLVGQRSVPTKGSAFTFDFKMVQLADFATPLAGLTVTAQVSKDGAAFAAAAGTVTEIGSGMYQFAATAADMNANKVTFRFTAALAAATAVTIVTDGGV